MIFGRPTNLWLALVTAALAFAQVLIINLVPGVDAIAVATILGSLGGFLAVVITLVANQPPSINVGDPYTVVTPASLPNVEKVANAYPTPPANLVAK
jgi:hypothetical protein